MTSKPTISLKPLTRKHLQAFDYEPVFTSKGVAIERDGEPVAIGVVSQIADNYWLMFDLKDTSFGVKRAIIKAWKRMDIPPILYTVQDTCPTAKGLIKHFGFTHYRDDIWQRQSLTLVSH